MKVKTNIRAGKQSGTALSNSDLGISGRDPNKKPSSPEVEAVTPAPTPVTYTRCVGI